MKKRTIWITAVLLLLLTGVAAAYIVIGSYYKTHFFENVSINGIDVSDLTAQEAEKLIAHQAEDYRVALVTKEGSQEVIEGSDIGYRFVSKGEVQGFLDEQSAFAWLPAYLGAGKRYTMETSMTYDEEKLETALSSLACMQKENVTAPKNAKVKQQQDGTYVIEPETVGNKLSKKKVRNLLKEAIEGGVKSVDLEKEECYKLPKVYQDDPTLRAEAAVRNRYSSITVTYEMGGGVTETLDKATIASWFSLDKDLKVSFDREAVAAWVDQLADQYDTIGAYLPFVTSNGETVYPESRTYGWQMDRETETEKLYQILLAGDSVQRSPVWLESAASRGENDIGDTYVEIDYTNQRMWYYKDGQLLAETPVVTGNVGAGMASPEGVFCLVGKQEDAVLTGEDYKTPVDYWMPFYGGVGIHDADTWRTSYGGDIYQWSGSHGCINTPTAQAAVIYQNIEVGTPVICYSSGVNYGYAQVGGGSGSQGNGAAGGTGNNAAGNGAAGGNGDIVIVDESTDASGGSSQTESSAASGSGGTQTDSADEDWADESLYYGDAEFPIVIEDEASYNGEQVIY